MNMLVKNGYIVETMFDNNYCYILNDSSHFNNTEFKVLQNQSDELFIKCAKLGFNGKIMILNLTKEFKLFKWLVANFDYDKFVCVLSGLIEDIIDIKQNGFLSCCNINLEQDYFYFDSNKNKIKLIYFPISQRNFSTYSEFELCLRKTLVEILSHTDTTPSQKIHLSGILNDQSLTLEDILRNIKKQETQPKSPKSGSLRLVAVNAPVFVSLDVNKDNFVIGRKIDAVDGAVTFNQSISRQHCVIQKQNGQYMISDLNSAFGTFVNGVKVEVSKSVALNNGDVIKLANSEFKVSII
jgi:hypothetical protein